MDPITAGITFAQTLLNIYLECQKKGEITEADKQRIRDTSSQITASIEGNIELPYPAK